MFDDLFKSLPNQISNELRRSVYKEELKKIKYFNDKSDYFINYVLYHLEKLEFNAFEFIYKKNDNISGIYFLLKGNVKLYFIQNNKKYLISQLQPGDMFGENEIFFNNSDRVYYAYSVTDTEIFFIDKKYLHNIYVESFPDCGNNLVKIAKNNDIKISNKLKKYKMTLKREKSIENIITENFINYHIKNNKSNLRVNTRKITQSNTCNTYYFDLKLITNKLELFSYNIKNICKHKINFNKNNIDYYRQRKETKKITKIRNTFNKDITKFEVILDYN